jgi:hypothetical protein
MTFSSQTCQGVTTNRSLVILDLNTFSVVRKEGIENKMLGYKSFPFDSRTFLVISKSVPNCRFKKFLINNVFKGYFI